MRGLAAAGSGFLLNRLIALVMLGTIGALVGVIIRGELAVWRSWSSLVLALAAIGLAGARTVPKARRLARRDDDLASQSRLARGVLRDHLVCFIAILAVLMLQLLPA
ncbi:MAG: hypothetical protein ACXVJW_15945 [Acidimicrobiia bacterium]